MSTPLLQTSPTVQLEVQPDRQLAANLVLSPDPTNSIRIRTTGVWAKKGQRRFPWQLALTTAQTILTLTNINQVVTWTSEAYDPDGLASLSTFPTRITATAAADYFSKVSAVLTPAAGSTNNLNAQLLLYKNGTVLVAASDLTAGLAAAVLPTEVRGTMNARVALLVGDYLEVYVRWVPAFTPGTPASATFNGVWSGGAITT